MSYLTTSMIRPLVKSVRRLAYTLMVSKGARQDEPVDLEALASLLYGIYGEEVIEKVEQAIEGADPDTVEKAWDASKHPRGKDGRFIPLGSVEARATAADEVMKAIRGDRSSSPQKLMSHLSILTVKQIRELARQHGKKVPSAIKSNLMESLRALVGGAATPIVPYESSRAVVPVEEKQPGEESEEDRTHPLRRHRKMLAHMLWPIFGPDSDDVAKKLGVSLNVGSLAHEIARVTKDDYGDAAKKASKITTRLAEHYRKMGYELPDEDVYRHLDYDSPEYKEKRKKQIEEQKEKQARAVQEAREFAEKHYKNPPPIETVSPGLWVALRIKQSMEELAKDLPKLQKLNDLSDRIADASSDRDHPDYDSRRRQLYAEFDELYQKPSTKKLIAKYKPSWWTRKDGTYTSLRGALENAKNRMRDVKHDWENDTISKYARTAVKAYEEHTEAIKKIVEEGKPISKEILDSYRYEKWMPESYRAGKASEHVVEAHGIYMEKEHPYYLSHFKAIMKHAKPKIDAFMERVEQATRRYDEGEYRQKDAELRKRWDDVYARHRRLLKTLDSMPYRLDSPHYDPIMSEQLFDKVNAAAVQLNNLKDEIKTLRERAEREWIHAVLSDEKNDSITIESSSHLTAEAQEGLSRATEFLRRVISPSIKLPPARIKERDPATFTREYYRESDSEIGANSNIADWVIVHEFGHHLEHKIGMAPISRAFAMEKIRESGEEVKQYGSRYELHEVGAKDGFRDEYIGKFYASGSSEVLSMGLQYLFQEPLQFYRESPEHFLYTVAAIKGWLT